MRKMLNVTGDKYQTFSADYCDMVVRMMADRLVVDRIEVVVNPTRAVPRTAPTGDDDVVDGDTIVGDGTGDDDKDQQWVDYTLKKNRFDALQMDVHEATLRDGDCFIIVDFDEKKQCARLNFNEAFDGMELGTLWPIGIRIS